MPKDSLSRKLCKLLMTLTRESSPSYRRNLNNKKMMKLDSSKKYKIKSRSLVFNSKKSPRKKSIVTFSYRTQEIQTLNFLLTLNSTTFSKTDKPFLVPSLQSNNFLVKRKVESRPKSMGSFVPKTRTLTKSGMMKSNTKGTERMSETLTKKLRNSSMKSITSLPWKTKMIDLSILIALSSLFLSFLKRSL